MFDLSLRAYIERLEIATLFLPRISRYDIVTMGNKSNSKLFDALSFALGLGFSIAIPIGGFIFLGFLGDRFLGTRPLFLIGGAVVGLIVSFYTAYRSLIPVMKDEEGGGDKKEGAGK